MDLLRFNEYIPEQHTSPEKRLFAAVVLKTIDDIDHLCFQINNILDNMPYDTKMPNTFLIEKNQLEFCIYSSHFKDICEISSVRHSKVIDYFVNKMSDIGMHNLKFQHLKHDEILKLKKKAFSKRKKVTIYKPKVKNAVP